MKIIEILRNEKKTQKELAKIAGVAQSSIGNYINGITKPDINTFIKFADYYNVSVDYLCDHENKNLIDISEFNNAQKSCINLISQLSRDNSFVLLGYLTSMIFEQNKKLN